MSASELIYRILAVIATIIAVAAIAVGIYQATFPIAALLLALALWLIGSFLRRLRT
ncbi:MAG: hypothetical protein P8Y71_23030 [Pseudolabrys sp.]|jgi:hypothetical protein